MSLVSYSSLMRNVGVFDYQAMKGYDDHLLLRLDGGGHIMYRCLEIFKPGVRSSALHPAGVVSVWKNV